MGISVPLVFFLKYFEAVLSLKVFFFHFSVVFSVPSVKYEKHSFCSRVLNNFMAMFP